METLFRVAHVIYEDSLKELIRDKNYPEEVNPMIKKAKKISDIRFSVPKDINPYKDSDRIRRSEIYINADLLNPLFSPIENGDIFEVHQGNKPGLYILLGQDCDLIVRKDGKRDINYGTFCKIDEKDIQEVIGEITSFAEKHGVQNHYLFNKFILDYFGNENDKVGIINFKKGLTIDLSILDLVVFNRDGEASSEGLYNINPNVLNYSWERRLKKLKDFYQQEQIQVQTLYDSVHGLNEQIRNTLLSKLTKSLGVGVSLGLHTPYNNNLFNYGIRRIKRLRTPYSKNMLDKYTKYLGRTADSHDFAKRFD